MIQRPFLHDNLKKPDRSAVSLCIVMIAVMLAVGCTTTTDPDNLTGTFTQTRVTPTMEKIGPFYKVTITQPEGIHPDYIKMDSDLFNQGEIIDFHVVNEGSGSLACWRTIPSKNFHLYRQIGTWESQPEPTGTHTDYGYYLKPGESTPVQQLNTADLTPGHYKIVTECGVSREFEIRAAPSVTQ